MEELKTQVQALNAQDWQTFLNWVVSDERARRESLPAVEQAQAEVVKELQDAGKLPLPDALTDPEALPADTSDVPEWVDPGTDHSAMYREGDIVRYKGRIVRSTHKGLNSWEPGTLGFDGRIWEDITPSTEPEEPAADGGDVPDDGVQPWEPGQTVALGDERSYNGVVYTVVQAHTTQVGWEPSVVPALWKVKEV